jgi:DNA modification methylase
VTVRIINADALVGLKEIPVSSVHLICTSPPYWRQRDYGVSGQLGLEPTPEQYIDALLAIFRGCARVLRDDGSCWINIGDKWATSGQGGAGYKRKDLIGLPFMLAFAMRADGWYWRSTEIWAKANGMTESTSDRPVVAHEYVLQFSKSEKYYYDAAAVRLPAVPESTARLGRAMRASLDGSGGFVMSGGGYAPPGQSPHSGARRSGSSTISGSPHGRHADTPLPVKERRTDKQRGHSRRHAGFNDRWDAMTREEQRATGAALRSVWWLPVANSPDAHFAVMPNELAATIILAGSPKGGMVLDPFGGSGTTALVADRLGRDATLIELKPEYVEIARRRIERDAGLFADVAA